MQTAKHVWNNAILVQNAVNPPGVLNTLVEMVTVLEQDNPDAGAAILEHPAVLLAYYGWCTLVRFFADYTLDDWSAAYNAVVMESDYRLNTEGYVERKEFV